MHAYALLCKLISNNLILLDFNLPQWPFTLEISSLSCPNQPLQAVSPFHRGTCPICEGSRQCCAPLSCINKLLIHGDILFQHLGLPVALSLPVCIDVQAAKSASNGYTEAAEAHGHWRDGVFLCFASRKPLFRQPRGPLGEEEVPADIRALGRLRRPLPFTLLPDMMDYFSPAPSAKHLTHSAVKACMYIFIFSIWDNSTPKFFYDVNQYLMNTNLANA